MPVFAVSLRGENFQIAIDGIPQRLGFYTTRFVRAQNEEDAENLAVEMVRKHQGLRAATSRDSPSTPMIYLERMERRPWWHQFRKQQGLAFWDMDSER